MTSRCVLSVVAEQDIDEIITYLAQENPVVAQTFLDALFDAMDNLAEYPELGHLREDLTDKPVKFWPFKWHYLIIYKPTSPLAVVRVLSGFRDIVSLIG
ncbi:type II toxin-antitoxin system RelE/ParE family toxin [Legionella quateirensis]|uniref:Plasmid stabilisation system protein n=1 Tax=Legionella quateirensis TaxID=45072 RepID=A0A378PA36_9GAMM|nr:type II toxin-antitoxin system RelE/ParE family toxin [Legionella quateirensis]KTD53929.1 Plasmid stabilization system protein [Legionella quateirensis]STY83020.1 Plasmid stabilisation system protein [Legionella quateirensis]